MYTLNLRPIAFAILLLTFLSMSGAICADAAISSPGTVDSCCLPSGQSNELPQAPCTSPECLCLFCLSLHLPLFADISFQPVFSTWPVGHLFSRPLAAFVLPIDYPPEHS